MEAVKEKMRKLQMFHAQKEEAMKKLFKQYWYDKLLVETEHTIDYIPKIHIEDFQKYINKKTNQRYRYIMFTINLKEGTPSAKALTKFEKCLKKKWIVNYFGAFEWRDLDQGMHIHLRVEISPDKNPYECKREVYNTFKHIVGSKLHVNARYSNRENCFFEYVLGIKKGKPKSTFTIDNQMRKKLGMDKFYTNIPLEEIEFLEQIQ